MHASPGFHSCGFETRGSASDSTLSLNTPQPQPLRRNEPIDLTVFPILEENTDDDGDFELSSSTDIKTK